MTIGVVIVVVAFVPKSPVATIDRIQAYSDALSYQVFVSDEDQAIIDGTLIVTLENQLETYKQPLVTGISVGLFDQLNKNQDYIMKVLADKGFGLEVLAETKIHTLDTLGASVIAADNMSSADSQMLFYNVKTYASDPLDEISAFYFTVAYEYSTDQYHNSVGTFPINEGVTETMVEGIPNQNVKVIITVYGVSANGDIEMDRLVIHTPFKIEASMYLQSVTDSTISVGAYGYGSQVDSLEFTLNLYNHLELIASMEIVFPDSSSGQEYEEPTYLFQHLRPDTLYRIEMVATYIDPFTFESIRVVCATQEARTLLPYDYTYQLHEFDTYYEVVIELNDPFDQFKNSYYYTYVYIDGMRQFYETNTSPLVLSDGIKNVSLVIVKPESDDYLIIVNINSNSSYYISQTIVEISPK